MFKQISFLFFFGKISHDLAILFLKLMNVLSGVLSQCSEVLAYCFICAYQICCLLVLMIMFGLSVRGPEVRSRCF